MLGAVLLTTGLIVYALIAKPEASVLTGPAYAVITVIPVATSTLASLPPTFTPPSTIPSTTITPTSESTVFALGVYVEITGTGGLGLRIRAAPGLNAAALFLGNDSEVFQITDGPREADGYVWWYLTAPYDSSRAGWAAQDYLAVISSPSQ